MSEPEWIDAAAVRYRGKIYIGVRHSTIKVRIWDEVGHFPHGYEEGFVTRKERFVSREEAAEIAFKSGQASQKYHKLYSENFNPYFKK